MSQALSPSEYVYEGVWINWHKDRGSVLGSTLTVNFYLASILSPAIAIFISIAGAQLWRLFQYALHQVRATSDARGLVYHQQQIILRNTGTDLNAIYRFVRTAIAWRHQKDAKVLWTSLPLVFWSIVHFSLIILAGLFSSRLLEAGEDVLTISPWCGTFNLTYGASLSAASQNITDQGLRLLQEYAHYHNARYAYVKQHIDICQNGENGTEGCDMMPVPELNWKARVLKGGCPFDGDVCHSSIEGPLSLDTGHISSNRDLGFNAPKGDRVALRLSAQCAPLNDAKYGTAYQQPATASRPSYEVTNALYGPSVTNSNNATFSQIKQYMDCDQRIALPAYFLNSVFAAANGSSGNFQPVSSIQKANADVSLISLVSNSLYIDPVLDPWFSAQESIVDPNSFCIGDNRTVYGREKAITTMGCTQQWQLCNTDSPKSDADEQCTAFMGLTQLQSYLMTPAQDVHFNPRQVASANRILNSAVSSSFYYVINALASSSGQLSEAASQMASNFGPAPPVDQWQTETKNWMRILLGILQQTSIDFGTGQFVASTSYINATEKVYKASPNDPEIAAAQWLCQNQIIHSKIHTNYNFFALMLLVMLCSIIIILGLSIEDVIGFVRQRSLRHPGKTDKNSMWNTNSDLEMLKTIDETKNNSIWSLSKNGVWVGPAGYKVSINSLRSEGSLTEKDRSLVNGITKRPFPGYSSATSPSKRGFSRSQTCSTFDSSSEISSPRKLTLTYAPADFKFQNTFDSDFEHAVPRIRVSEVNNPSPTGSQVGLQLSPDRQRTPRFPIIPSTQIINEDHVDPLRSNSPSKGRFTEETESKSEFSDERIMVDKRESTTRRPRSGFWNMGLNRASRTFVQ